MSGHLDGPPPGPPDPPYIEGDLGAPSAEEFVHKRRSARAMSTTPDERLREAGERLAQAVARVCGEGHPALGLWRVALAAADREAPDQGVWPDQSAVHGVLLEQVKDAYAEGITDTVAKLRARAAEVLPEVARFTLDEIEAICADREAPDEPRCTCRCGPQVHRADCPIRSAPPAPPVSDEQENGR